MHDQYDKASLPQVWDELRRKVNDNASSLPSGCLPPVVVDDYGDVYGMYFVLYGDGYSMAELKEHAKMLRRELLLCDQVAKIDMTGSQNEVVYFEISRARLANLGISPAEIKALVSGQNDPAESGHLTIGDKYVRIDPTGKLASLEDLGNLLVVRGDAEGRPSVRLRDIATIRRGYEDPPSAILRYNGHPCIALGVSTVAGGTVTVMAQALNKRLKELESATPIGMEIGMTRQATEKTRLPEYARSAKVFPPENERMGIEEMLLGYTINGAKQLGIEARKGSIEVGKDADFLVFDNDLLTAEHEGFSFNKPTDVYLCGRKMN